MAFRLQRILDHRISSENLARMALAAAMSDEMRQRRQLNETRTEKDALHRRFLLLQQEGMFASDIILYDDRDSYLVEKIHTLEQSLAETQKRVLFCRAQLVEASRQKKVLEQLKERQALEEAYEERRRERVFADEMAGRSHWRNK